MIRVIALDVDGTLLDPKGEITPETREAIARARAEGVKVVLATGRRVQEAIAFGEKAGCDNLAVCVGGAVLADLPSGTHVRDWEMPSWVWPDALKLCLNRGIELMLFAGEKIVVDPFSKASQEKTFPDPVFHREAVVAEDPLAYLQENDLPLLKIHADWAPEAYPMEELKKLYGLQVFSTNGRDMEVLPAGADKGRALALLGVMYGFALDEIAAVGDSDNDLAMLKVAGYPVAMGNATQAVKDAAKYITAGNDENGADKAILHILEQNKQTN
jgi:Cof subfamily protein (haloacid dehalogenase superfamily)